MKRVFITIASLIFVMTITNAQCTDISTQDVVNYLNREIKPRLDLKLDKDDGFLAIKRKRQDLVIDDFRHRNRRTGTRARAELRYSFQNVRRVDSNFFYDSNRNLFALDVKFESDGPEIKGVCSNCDEATRDSRVPDIDWSSVQILRLYLKPIVYDASISLEVEDLKFIGEFELIISRFAPKSTRDTYLPLMGKIVDGLKTQLQRVFENGQTQRLFNDALQPLLSKKNVSYVRSVSLATSSLRTCR